MRPAGGLLPTIHTRRTASRCAPRCRHHPVHGQKPAFGFEDADGFDDLLAIFAEALDRSCSPSRRGPSKGEYRECRPFYDSFARRRGHAALSVWPTENVSSPESATNGLPSTSGDRGPHDWPRPRHPETRGLFSAPRSATIARARQSSSPAAGGRARVHTRPLRSRLPPRGRPRSLAGPKRWKKYLNFIGLGGFETTRRLPCTPSAA